MDGWPFVWQVPPATQGDGGRRARVRDGTRVPLTPNLSKRESDVSQAEVPAHLKRAIDSVDPYRWSAWESLFLSLELGVIALLTPPFVLAFLVLVSLVALAVWFVNWLDRT